MLCSLNDFGDITSTFNEESHSICLRIRYGVSYFEYPASIIINISLLITGKSFISRYNLESERFLSSALGSKATLLVFHTLEKTPNLQQALSKIRKLVLL